MRRDFPKIDHATTFADGSFLKYDSVNDLWVPEPGVPSYANVVKETQAELHVYVDSSRPDDTGDGLSWGAAKKTLQAGVDLIPYLIKHNVCLHCQGTFTDFGQIYFRNYITYPNALLIDGGSDLSTISGGGPFTAGAGSTTEYIEVSGAGWTVDAYAGWWIECPNGSGTTYLVQSNTAERAYVTKLFGVAQSGQEFRFVRPTTTFSASSTYSVLNLWGIGGFSKFCIQNLYFTGSKVSIYNYGSTAALRMAGVISDSSATAYFLARSGSFYNVLSSNVRVNSATFATETTGVGHSHRGTGGVWMESCLSCAIMSGYFNSVLLYGCILGSGSSCVFYGTRINSLVIDSCRINTGMANASTYSIQSSSGYATTKIGPNPSGNGLTVRSSDITILDPDISGNSGHGIEANDSRLTFIAAVSGTGNTGAGLYAHGGSQVTIKDGSPPTLTGTVGDISTDGTTEAISWAAVDAGMNLSDGTEHVLVKEVA